MKFKNVLLLLLFFAQIIISEEVCKFSYKNDPASLDKKTLELPHGAVAMSEFVNISNSSEVLQIGGASSIFFVIDNSNSMFIVNNGSGGSPAGFDIDGARYLATSELIDSIYKMSPDSKIGLALFSTQLYFDPNDDDLFEEVVNYEGDFDLEGGFVPLLQLNKKVTKGKYSGMTGYETLKDILKVKLFEGRKIKTYTGAYLDIPPYTNIEYEPSNFFLDPVKVKDVGGKAGTNIWGGFAAAKEAMLTSGHSKENQHIIFYSDGSNMTFNNEGPKFSWDDSAAANTPATYTVFFAENNAVSIANLTRLKDKIKNNNYSLSNLNSELWAMSAGKEVLVNLFMDNVIKEIITNITTVIPKNIKIKGLDPVTSWDGKGFMFSAEFPLIGKTTPISYDIEYEIGHDSIIGGDTINVSDKDTSLSISYDAIVMDNPNTPDSCMLAWWGRSMSLKENGVDLTVIENRTGVIDVIFDEYKVDTVYDYSNVKIEVTSNTGDKETLSLSKSGNSHTVTIDREVGTANIGDGKLQYGLVDNLVFRFLNPVLPLDTLRKEVPVDAAGLYVVSKVVYKDNDADGFVDNVILGVLGDDVSSNRQAIVDLISFPIERNIVVNNSTASGSRIIIDVTEQSSTIRTFIESFDRYTLSDTATLLNDALLAPFDIVASDSMAPVVLSASLIDSVKDGAEDLLTVVFSENPLNVDNDSPLAFYRNGNGASFSADLDYLSISNSTVQYSVLSGGIKSGDSLNVNSSATSIVKDSKNNEQGESKNRKVEIDVTLIEDRLYVVDGSYFDSNGDGWVDEITVSLSKSIDASNLNKVVNELVLDNDRNFEILSSSYSSGIISLKVNDRGSNIKTTTLGEQISVNDSVVISSELILTPGTVNVRDSVAPVIISASLIDSIKEGSADMLSVEFSESVEDENSSNALSFYENGSGDLYSETLDYLSKSGSAVKYRLIDTKIKSGDSVNINSNAVTIIKDSEFIEQNNLNNRKVEIDITIIEDNLVLLSSSFFDDNADGWVDRITLGLSKDIENGMVGDIVKIVDLGNIRTLTINAESYSNRVITLNVSEAGSDRNTATVNEVVKITDSLDLSEELLLVPCEVSVNDSMAPVVVEAHLIDSVVTEVKGKEVYLSKRGEDILTVTYSEDLGKVGTVNPFKFHNGSPFDIKVEINGFKDNEMECKILDRDIISEGDSLSILFDLNNLTSDSVTNIQKNSDNLPCPIDITIIESIAYVPADIEFILKSTLLEYNKTVSLPGGWETEDGKSGDLENVMIITLEPDDKENFTVMDEISAVIVIYDNLGNIIKSDMDMKFDSERKMCHLVWSGKNSKARLVGSGIYVAQARVSRYFSGEELPIVEIKEAIGVKASKR